MRLIKYVVLLIFLIINSVIIIVGSYNMNNNAVGDFI